MVIDVAMADDDIISVTCDDDLEEEESLEAELREKFRIEREIKKEKIDDYPDFHVFTTHLPGKKTSPNSSPDSETPTSNLDDSPPKHDKVKQCSGGSAKESFVPPPEPKECTSKETMKDKDPKKDSSGLKTKGSDTGKKGSSRPSTHKYSSKSDACKVDETEARKRKQDTSRSVQRKKIFVHADEARHRAPGLEEFLWRKMRRIQQQNRHLYQLVEKLSAKLNDRTSFNQAALNRVQDDGFTNAPRLAQRSFQNHESIPASPATYTPWLNQVSYQNPIYPTQTQDLSNRMVHHQQAEERAVYARPHDEYLALGPENGHGHVGLREGAERFPPVIPTYTEDYCAPHYSNVHSAIQGNTLAYPDDLSVNQVQVVRNQMVQDPSRLEGRMTTRRILERETALQRQQEQYRSLEASYQESCNRGSQAGHYHETELQRFEQPQQRNIMVQPRSVVDHFEFDGQNGPVMGVIHEERLVRKRPVLCQNQEYAPPLSRGAESMAHVTEIANCRDRRQVEYQRRFCPLDARSVEVGSNYGTLNQLAVESIDQSRYWQGGQFFGRRS